MKTYFLSTIIVCIAILLNTSSCTQNDNTSEIDVGSTSDSTATSPMLTFEESNHDFGTVIQGEKVSHSFIYINTGNADLIISSATGSCGCTVPEYSKEPLAPGESRKMNVIFDSSGKMGRVDKSVTIVSNCNPNMQKISISANIINP